MLRVYVHTCVSVHMDVCVRKLCAHVCVCTLTAYACVCVRIDLCVYVWCGIGMHGSVCVQYAMCSHVCVCVHICG